MGVRSIVVKLPRWLPGAAGIASLFACAAAPGHFPDPQNVPLFGKAGETRLNVAIAQLGNGIGIESGWAVGKNVALVANGAYSKPRSETCPGCRLDGKQHLELGAGLFDRMDQGLIREVYAGLGGGRFKASGFTSDWDPAAEDLVRTSGDYRHVFLQGDMGLNGSILDWIGSVRLSAFDYHHFRKLDGNGMPLPVAARHMDVFLEPALTFRLGYRQLKTETQLGFSMPLHQAENLDNEMIWLSLGVSLSAFGP
jgi:hypothetical protein